MQLIVLGMHRSGTSAVSRLLAMMGAYCGTEEVLMPPSDDNPKGYWERRDVQALNEVLLASLGVEWDRLAAWGKRSLKERERQWFERRLRLILTQLEPQRPWFVKDPRLCLLLSYWRPLLEVPVCVHVFRHPAAVARSLLARNGCPLPVGLALWELYTLEALAASRDLPRVLVSFDELLSDPTATVRRLLDGLSERGVRRLELPSELEIERFVDRDLDHHGQPALTDPGPLNKAQRVLYEALEAAAPPCPLPKLSTAASKALEDYERSTPADLEERQERLEQFRRRLATTPSEAAAADSLQARLDAARAERRRLSRELWELRSAMRPQEPVSRAELEEWKTRLSRERSLLRFREWQVEDLSTRLKTEGVQGRELEAELERVKKKAASSKTDLSVADEERNRLSAELETAQARIAELELHEANAHEQLRAAERQVDRLAAQLQESQQEAQIAQSSYLVVIHSRSWRVSRRLLQIYDLLTLKRWRRPAARGRAVERQV